MTEEANQAVGAEGEDLDMTRNLFGSDGDPTSDTAHHRDRHHARSDAVDDTAVIRLQGDLDLATAPRVGQSLASALDARPAVLALDLEELTFLDSTGIRVLIAAHRRAEGQGSRFILRSPQPPVLRTLKLTGVDRLFVIDGE